MALIRGIYDRFDTAEKPQITVFMNLNPKEWFSNVARIFSDRFTKNINKMHFSGIKK